MTGSSTTGRKYHRPSARDRAWIAFVVHGCSADGVVAPTLRGMLHGVVGGDRRAPPSIPRNGQTAGAAAITAAPAVCPRTQRFGARPKGRAPKRLREDGMG